jgi:hypothetical protein
VAEASPEAMANIAAIGIANFSKASRTSQFTPEWNVSVFALI